MTGTAIKVSNGKNHVLIRSADDLILNGKKMDKFNKYSGSGKLYIDKLAGGEQEFVAESIERVVRRLPRI
jgi:hypothetical protein